MKRNNDGLVSRNTFVAILVIAFALWMYFDMDHRVNSAPIQANVQQAVQAVQPAPCEGSGLLWALCVAWQEKDNGGR